MTNMTRYQEFVDHGNFTRDARDSKFLVGLGLAGEGGEVAEIVKKHLLHDKPLDRHALVLELGDVLWYLMHGLNAFDISLDEVVAQNVIKLCDRHPKQYGNSENWLKNLNLRHPPGKIPA